LYITRRIFLPKRDEMVEGLRKLHNEELRNVYSSPRIIRMIESRRIILSCSTHGQKRNAYRTFAGNPEGKRSLGRPRRR
jgi:hypothetical protein